VGEQIALLTIQEASSRDPLDRLPTRDSATCAWAEDAVDPSGVQAEQGQAPLNIKTVSTGEPQSPFNLLGSL
jgi:hypothetical protein